MVPVAALSLAGALAVVAFAATPASAAQSLTTCQKLAGDKAIRLPSSGSPCDKTTTVYTSVSKLVKKKTVWSFVTSKAVPLPAGCAISNTPGPKKCKLVRAATEKVLLFKADPVRFSGTAGFSKDQDIIPTNLKSFSIASVNFLATCTYDEAERLVVKMSATSPLASSATSSGITMSSQTRPPFTATSAVQTMATGISKSPFGGEQTFTAIDRGLVVQPSGLGADAVGMFTYLVDVGSATVTVNASVRVSSPAYYYEEGISTCSVSGSAFATLDA